MPLMPEPTPVCRRILLVPTTGSRKDISIICGTDDQLKAQLTVSELPTFISEVSFGDHLGAACLVRVGPRTIEYRELISPAQANAEMFHPDQQ